MGADRALDHAVAVEEAAADHAIADDVPDRDLEADPDRAMNDVDPVLALDPAEMIPAPNRAADPSPEAARDPAEYPKKSLKDFVP